MKTYKWTEQQKKALRASIKHWRKIVSGEVYTSTLSSCACCRLWNNPHETDCPGCPIEQFTGEGGCNGTPYPAFQWAQSIHRSSTARSELNFLRAVYLAGGGK